METRRPRFPGSERLRADRFADGTVVSGRAGSPQRQSSTHPAQTSLPYRMTDSQLASQSTIGRRPATPAVSSRARPQRPPARTRSPMQSAPRFATARGAPPQDLRVRGHPAPNAAPRADRSPSAIDRSDSSQDSGGSRGPDRVFADPRRAEAARRAESPRSGSPRAPPPTPFARGPFLRRPPPVR